MGTMIGGGIFVSPKGVLEEIESVGGALIMWTFCGMVVLCGALSYSELGTMFPRSGGPYEYILEAFGDFIGFMYCWVEIIIVVPTANAVIALTFAYYALEPFYPAEESPTLVLASVAVLAITLVGYIGAYSVKLSSIVQNLFTVLKTIALVVIIVIGIYGLSIGNVSFMLFLKKLPLNT